MNPPYFSAAAMQHCGSSGTWGALISLARAAKRVAYSLILISGSDADSSVRSCGSRRTLKRHPCWQSSAKFPGSPSGWLALGYTDGVHTANMVTSQYNEGTCPAHWLMINFQPLLSTTVLLDSWSTGLNGSADAPVRSGQALTESTAGSPTDAANVSVGSAPAKK